LIIGHVFEHDVVLDQVLILFLIDEVFVLWCYGVVSTAVLFISNELCEYSSHFFLKINPLVSAHGRRQRKLTQVPSNTNTHRQGTKTKSRKIQFSVLGEAFNPLKAPVVSVLFVGEIDLVVLFQSPLEKRFEFVVVTDLISIASH